MRTLSSKRTGLIWKRSESPQAGFDAEESTPLIGRGRSESVRPNLVESEEYEWVGALNMPGLIVSPRMTEPSALKTVARERHDVGEIVETEDGDTTRACQLPGGLCADSSPSVFAGAAPRHCHELQCEDEYSELAAMQMPGRLVTLAKELDQETTSTRGLCTTCIHNANCDFTRPAGGVWRCEEYA